MISIPSDRQPVIVSAARTPTGRLLGALSAQSASDLGGAAIEGALSQSALAPDQVDYVIMGHVLQAGTGQITARQAAVKAGIPMTVPAITLNKVCLSGLDAIALAAQLIRLGEHEVIVAGGMESMTGAPHLLPRSRSGYKYGPVELADAMALDGLTDPFDHISMGESTERHLAGLGIGREEQDAFAALSHQRAAAAVKEGRFAAEFSGVAGLDGVSGLTEDEGVRPDTSEAKLARLRPAFSAGGTITAGNSSQISDGAAALLVMSAAAAERAGLEPLARIGAHGNVAGPDNSLPSQPSNAIKQALGKDGLTPDQVDLFEINEAFAAVAIQSMRDLGLDPSRAEKVNVDGGAIAVGHPLGASGARIVVHLVHELRRRGGGLGAAGLCGGGGQGAALLVRV